MDYIEAFNGFRGYGFLQVVLDHYTYPNGPALDFGQFGVGMFYVLSSYLLTLILYKQYLEKGSLNLANYWIRRFFRIYPLLFLNLIFEYFMVKRYNFETLKGIFFLTRMEGIYWTIFIEMRFYVIIPLVVFVFAKLQNLYIKFGSMLFITFLGFCYHYYWNFIKGGFSFMLWNIPADDFRKNIVFINYLPVFLLGSFMAIIVYHLKKAQFDFNKNPNLNGSFILIMSLIHFPFIFYRFFFSGEKNAFWDIPWGNFNGIFCLGYCFIFMFFNGKNFMSRFFGFKAIAFFGNISYPGYLFHQGIREYFFRHWNWEKTFKDLFTCFIITVIISYILHITIENYFINLTKMWCLPVKTEVSKVESISADGGKENEKIEVGMYHKLNQDSSSTFEGKTEGDIEMRINNGGDESKNDYKTI